MVKVSIEEKELDRLKAENRANVMSRCFNKKCFELFVDAINDELKNLSYADLNKPGTKWSQACERADLEDPKQREWLWNYLKHYDSTLRWNQSSARNGW